ncbi:hypothetical protein BJV74DRAFT_795149 [Russula compacta]|nr:hypothetical protein BJV74DRAFT_795149 [Russula compacta]
MQRNNLWSSEIVTVNQKCPKPVQRAALRLGLVESLCQLAVFAASCAFKEDGSGRQLKIRKPRSDQKVGGLRTLFDQLQGAHSSSVEEFKSIISEGVETFAGTTSVFRDGLISQVRGLTGFGAFMRTSTLDTLSAATSRGPVIAINNSKWRSDVLILPHDSPPSLIPTPTNFYDDANSLKDRLLDARNNSGPGTDQHELSLSSVLADLYNLVGRPAYKNNPEFGGVQRLFFVPSSPIPSDDGVRRYFSDVYISSYTPILSALTQSPNPAASTLDPPSLLLIAQPDPLPSLSGRRREIEYTVTEWTLVSGKPFDASFQLHGDGRLTLIDIFRSHLPAAEFAFLSASHTAEQTDESIADAALHFAATMLNCGFRSVVGTMWEVLDTDRRDLKPYHEKSAKALRDAVADSASKKRDDFGALSEFCPLRRVTVAEEEFMLLSVGQEVLFDSRLVVVLRWRGTWGLLYLASWDNNRVVISLSNTTAYHIIVPPMNDGRKRRQIVQCGRAPPMRQCSPMAIKGSDS